MYERLAAVTVAVVMTAAACDGASNAPSSPVAQTAAINDCPTPTSRVLATVPTTASRNVALTFDDGPSGKWTPQVLDILKANDVKATFFMIGENARAYPELVRRVVAEGHAIGNHTYDHPRMESLSPRAQAAQLDSAARYISAAIDGGYKPCFFRPPYGSYNETTVTLARDREMSSVYWSQDTEDWTTPLHFSTTFQRTIVNRATNPLTRHPNVTLHDGSPGDYRQNTIDSLQRIITFYKQRGYRFTDPAGR